MDITLKGIFDRNSVIGVKSVNRVPKNAKHIHTVDNYFVYSNLRFLFFKERDYNGQGTGKTYKKDWNYDIEQAIMSTI